MCPCTACRQDVWPQGLHGCPGNYINQERILIQVEQSRKAERFHWKTTPVPLHVHFSHLWFDLTLLIHTFRVIKKNKKRSRLYFYTSALFFFPVYNTNKYYHPGQWTWKYWQWRSSSDLELHYQIQFSNISRTPHGLRVLPLCSGRYSHHSKPH